MKWNRIKNFLITILPYFLVIILGSIFLVFSYLNNSLSDLWVGLAGTSYSIVLVLSVFDLSKYYTGRYLNAEIHRYINLKISDHLLKILAALSRLTAIDYTKGTSLLELKHLTDWESNLLHKTLRDKIFLGFDIFIKWDNYIPDLEKLLESNINLQHLNSTEILWLLDIYKALISFSHTYDIFIKDNYFELINHKTELLKVFSNTNDWFYLQYNNKEIAENYFNNEHIDNSLKIYKLNPTKSKEFSRIIYNVIKKFENSPILKKEIILDPRSIRIEKAT